MQEPSSQMRVQSVIPVYSVQDGMVLQKRQDF